MTTHRQRPQLSLVVPLKVARVPNGLLENYKQLLRNPSIELVLVDECNDEIFDAIHCCLQEPNIVHTRIRSEHRSGTNGKLNALETGLRLATHDKICFIDDDFRLTSDTLSLVDALLEQHEVVKCMVYYQPMSVACLSSTCTILIKDILTAVYDEGYEPAHLCFRRSVANRIGMPDKSILFDDLVLLRHFRKHGYPPHLARNVFLEKRSPSWRKFLEQRIRYAYEELAYPWLFAAYLLSWPAIVVLGVVNARLGIACALLPCLAATITTWFGLRRMPRGYYPKVVLLYAPVWFWSTATFVWTTPFVYLRGGCKFGGTRIKRVA